MKEKSKNYIKIIGMELLFMLSAVVVAYLAVRVQFIGKKYTGSHTGLFGGDDFQYNIFSYIAGIVIFFGYLVFIYKIVFKKYINLLAEYNIGMKLLAWFICAAFSAGMYVIIVIDYFLLLGLTDIIEPECLLFVTCWGWPIITAILFAVILVTKSVRASKKQER